MDRAADCRRFADACRALAAHLSDPNDQDAMELMAAGWDKAADKCEAGLSKVTPPDRRMANRG